MKNYYKAVISLLILLVSILGIIYTFNQATAANFNQNFAGQEISVNLPEGLLKIITILTTPILLIIFTLSTIGLSTGGYYFIKYLIHFNGKDSAK